MKTMERIFGALNATGNACNNPNCKCEDCNCGDNCTCTDCNG
jgi:hypothetical protein